MNYDEMSVPELTAHVLKLEGGNARSYAELRQKTNGQFGMNTSDMRRELFIDSLVEWGIITPHQKMKFEAEFQTRVESALNDAWSEFRKYAGPQLSVVREKRTILGPNGRPL